MAEDQDKQGLPWLLRRVVAENRPGAARLDQSGAMYRLYTNTRNPFLKRAIAPAASKLERSPQELAGLFHFLRAEPLYRVAPGNETSAHLRRTLEHPAPVAPPHPRFQAPPNLPGDLAKLPWLVDEFFRAIIARLRADPGEFDAVVSELVALFRQHDIKIRLYEAYYALQDWDDLLQTLEEIAHYPAVETFDLFCSALFAYHDLVYPPP